MRCPWGLPGVSVGRPWVARGLPVSRLWVTRGLSTGIVSPGMPMEEFEVLTLFDFCTWCRFCFAHFMSNP